MSQRVQGFVGYRTEDAGLAGMPGVLVSNGEAVTTTDEGGHFSLPAPDTGRPIFISTPAGYRAVGQFFQHCEGPSTPTFELALAPERSEQDHSFILLADYQWEPGEVMQATFERVASDPVGPRFIIHAGDLFHVVEGAPVKLARWYYESYHNFLRGFELPVYNVIGNHDQVNGPAVSPEMPEFGDRLFEQTLGPTYYSFDWGNVHYVVLNAFEIEGKQQHTRGLVRQLRWLEADLAYQPADKPLILAAHRPPLQWENREALLRVLAGRDVRAFFAGDWHRDVVFQCRDDWFPSIVTPTPYDNLRWFPPGYRAVEVRGRKVKHTYRLLHSLDELYPVRPAPGSNVSGRVDLVMTEHVSSDRAAKLAHSIDGEHWTPLLRVPISIGDAPVYNGTSAEWRAQVDVHEDTKLMIRAAEDSVPAAYTEISLNAVPSPVVWQQGVARRKASAYRSRPAVAGSLVIVGEDNGLRAFSAKDGELAWTHEESQPWRPGTPLAMAGHVIVASWEGSLLALNQHDGSVAWRAEYPFAFPASEPTALGDCCVVGGMARGSWDGTLLCLDPATGEVRWQLQHDYPFVGKPLCADGRMWTSSGNVVLCLDLASGREIWRTYPEHTALYGGPLLAQGRLFAPDADGWTYVLDPDRGELLDRFLALQGLGFAGDGDLIYAGCRAWGLRAYDPLSYEERWRFWRPGSYFTGRPALRERDLVAASSDGNIYLIDKATGQANWSFQFGGVGGQPVTLGDHRGYVVTEESQLVAFDLPGQAEQNALPHLGHCRRSAW